MAISTFDELKTAIGNWLERDDLTSRLPEFIAIAEARHRREIRSRLMLTRAQATLSANTKYLALPAGYLAMRELSLLTNPITPVRQASPSAIRRELQQSANGRPRFFCVHEELEFNRTADQDYTAEMIYWKQFTALSASNATNTLLTNHPDIYLYSSLAAASPFLADDERIRIWNDLYLEAAQELRRADRQDQWTQGSVHSTPRVVAY